MPTTSKPACHLGGSINTMCLSVSEVLTPATLLLTIFTPISSEKVFLPTRMTRYWRKENSFHHSFYKQLKIQGSPSLSFQKIMLPQHGCLEEMATIADCQIELKQIVFPVGGAIAIHKQILHQTLQEKNLETYSPSEISGIVRNRLSRIKVLIVLDNVDESDQLEKLAINPEWLLTGSRIIITTRDEHILKAYGADAIHKVQLLNDNDARELFHRKAFRSDDPMSKCIELTPAVLKYAKNLPLAIRVVGSFLCTRNATQWEDASDRLRSNPDNKIMDVLQISFEGLLSEEKEIFLHITCFFKGKNVDYITRILDCCGLHPHIGIRVVIDKSLITIRNQEIHMHELLQDLGKKIVRQQFPLEPGSWSRLWLYQDFHHVLTTETGTSKVKAVVLDQNEDVSECPQLKVEGLSIMRDLRILILYYKNFS